jgi:hypothetical protein
MYVKVYAPNGEMFEVIRERADRLILQEGWTQSPHAPVIDNEIPEEIAVKRPRAKKPRTLK